jgi:chaperonin GroES
MKLVPLGDKIVVERLEAEDKTKGGIYLPESAKEKPKQGKVVSVGPGKVLDSGSRGSMTLKKGDLVLFTSYAGTEVEVSGKEVLIMSEDDVMAVIG